MLNNTRTPIHKIFQKSVERTPISFVLPQKCKKWYSNVNYKPIVKETLNSTFRIENFLFLLIGIGIGILFSKLKRKNVLRIL